MARQWRSLGLRMRRNPSNAWLTVCGSACQQGCYSPMPVFLLRCWPVQQFRNPTVIQRCWMSIVCRVRISMCRSLGQWKDSRSRDAHSSWHRKRRRLRAPAFHAGIRVSFSNFRDKACARRSTSSSRGTSAFGMVNTVSVASMMFSPLSGSISANSLVVDCRGARSV